MSRWQALNWEERRRREEEEIIEASKKVLKYYQGQIDNPQEAKWEAGLHIVRMIEKKYR